MTPVNIHPEAFRRMASTSPTGFRGLGYTRIGQGGLWPFMGVFPPTTGMKFLLKMIAPAAARSDVREARSPWGRGLALSLLASSLAAVAGALPGQVTPFCLGDGTGAPCPCGNNGGPGEGCKSSAGAGAFLAYTGAADVVTDTLDLQVMSCPPNTPGVFFGGNGGNGSFPFGNGLRCVTGDIVRIKTVFCDGTGSATSGPGIAAKEGLSAGDVRYYQFWYRDIIGPCGAAYNTSSGFRVQW